jgi:hypothetical protein
VVEVEAADDNDSDVVDKGFVAKTHEREDDQAGKGGGVPALPCSIC